MNPEIISVTTEGNDLDTCRRLFTQYQQELGVDLCFQGFSEELANPLKKYGPPGGLLLLALINSEPAGCIALHPLPEPGVCEMKRLYVLPAYRKTGLGRQLVERLLAEACQLNYAIMRLDTLANRMQAAVQLYRNFGFMPIAAYTGSPEADVLYMEKRL